MKKTFFLLAFAVFFVSCSTSFAQNTKPVKAFNKVDFNSLLSRQKSSQNLPTHGRKITNPTKQNLKNKVSEEKPSAKIETPKFTDGKTRGNYLGLNFLDVETSYFERTRHKETDLTSKEIRISDTFSNSSYGVGIDYKYAFNFNDFFIAPGILLERLSYGRANVHQNNDPIRKLQVKDRYGIKADFGYDFSKISPFITLGYAAVSYRVRMVGTDTSHYESDGTLGNDTTIVNTGVKGSPFWGLGLKINYSKDTSLNLEYNMQKFVSKVSDPVKTRYYLDGSQIVVDLKVMKLGVSYNF